MFDVTDAYEDCDSVLAVDGLVDAEVVYESVGYRGAEEAVVVAKVDSLELVDE
jgi:hypothetical protein